jgi:hypothetical protein
MREKIKNERDRERKATHLKHVECRKQQLSICNIHGSYHSLCTSVCTYVIAGRTSDVASQL